MIANRIIELTNITEGRSLVLFTAKEDLRHVYEIINSKAPQYPLFIQMEGSSQANILHEFRERNGILLGTGIFWEGVDIKGADLSQVIIVRLPFPVPDPIIEHKLLQVNNRMDVLLPEMLIKLRQGAGRLIRSEADTGILSILDSRICSSSKKDYKDHIYESLPIKIRTESLDELREFAKAKISPLLSNKSLVGL